MTIRFCRRLATLAILAGGLAIAANSTAHAAFTLTLTDFVTGDTVTVNDRILGIGDANDASNAANTIVYLNQLGNFDVQITIKTQSPGTGPLGAMVQDVTITTNNIGSVQDTLTAEVNSDGFTNPNVVGAQMALYSSLASSQVSSGGSATFTSSLNGQPTVPTLFLNSAPGGVDTSTAVTITTVPYTLTNTLAITLGANGSGQFTGTTEVTPEPATLAMAFSALPIFGFAAWRRRRKQG